jgi:hypothetical protein
MSIVDLKNHAVDASAGLVEELPTRDAHGAVSLQDFTHAGRIRTIESHVNANGANPQGRARLRPRRAMAKRDRDDTRRSPASPHGEHAAA